MKIFYIKNRLTSTVACGYWFRTMEEAYAHMKTLVAHEGLSVDYLIQAQ